MAVELSGIKIVSKNSSGVQGNLGSNTSSLSPDGRLVVFTSDASSFTVSDTNGASDVFLRNLSGGAVTLISQAGGVSGNGGSGGATFSSDGTKILFTSVASDLVAGDTNGREDVFVKDLITGTLTRVSTETGGAQLNGASTAPAFSGDGRSVVFQTNASNAGRDGNTTTDIFVKDLETGILRQITYPGTAANSFSTSPSISFDGSRVAFTSAATNFGPTDTNNAFDVYVKDANGGYILASSNASGVQGNSFSSQPVLSPDGTKVAFASTATNLAGTVNGVWGNIFLKDLVTGTVTLVSSTTGGTAGNMSSFSPVFSPDGNFIIFNSLSTNFGGPKNIESLYAKNLETGELTRLSVNENGESFNGWAIAPAFSPDGNTLTFSGSATNATGHTDTNNNTSDVFTAHFTGNPHIFNGINTAFETITATNLGDVINGLGGTDVISGLGGRDVVYAGAGDDDVEGGDGDDVIYGGTGKDALNGDNGKDYIDGGDHGDVIHGGDDGDRLFGGKGNDAVYGENGEDVLRGGEGNDLMSGGNDRDELRGDAGDDRIYGNDGEDFLYGGDGNDQLFGGGGDNLLQGNAGNDILWGGGKTDTISGGGDDDELHGGGGSDQMFADDGNDTLYGGTGTNSMTGGTGADTFVIDADSFDGHADKVQDFTLSQGDSIELQNVLVGYDPLTSDINDFVALTAVVTNNQNTMVSVDRDGDDGAYGFTDVFLLVRTSGLDADDMLASGALTVST